jgi:colicin import membrane protein
VTEKVKEKVEKEGLAARARSLEGLIQNYEFLSERIEDVIKIASLFYNERLDELGAKERREVRRKESEVTEREAQREQHGEIERQAARRKERKGMGKKERKEAETEEKKIELEEKEKSEARRKEREEAETEEKKIELGEKEKREARRKERRETRIT